MNRILCIIGTLDVGGAETFMMKILRNMNRDECCIDFLMFTDRECAYNEEAKSLGSRLLIAPAKSNGLRSSLKAIEEIVRENGYKTVLKISEFSLGALDLWAAKNGGAKVLMMRSSNAGTTENKVISVLHYLFRPIANRIVNVKMAPSTEAARYTFGNVCIKKNNIVYIKNGLKLSDIVIDDKTKKCLIDKLGINDKYIVAHIGRFCKQKNHKYLIKVFKEIKNKRDNAVLLLFGDGELREDIISQIERLGLIDDVIFMGIRNNILEYLSLIDVIVFPSLFEGMPNVIVEAQAAGVPCLISNTITKEVKLTDLVKFMSINDLPEKWADTALQTRKQSIVFCQKQMRANGYDIKDSINTIISNSYILEKVDSNERKV